MALEKETQCDDILQTPHSSLMIPVNCVGVMGKGLALQAKKKWPEIEKPYKEHCRKKLLYPGHCTFVETEDFKTVILFPTKDHWRAPSKWEWIDDGLKDFVHRTNGRDLWMVSDVAIPPLGCGEGGLIWNCMVLPLLIKHLFYWHGCGHYHEPAIEEDIPI